MRYVLLAAALVAALLRIPHTERVVRDVVKGADAVRTVDGVSVPGSYPNAALLVARAKAEIPPDAPVLIVVRGNTCVRFAVRDGFGLVFWLQYQLLPRHATCRLDAAWQVWALGGPIPPGAEVVAPGYAIVHPR